MISQNKLKAHNRDQLEKLKYPKLMSGLNKLWLSYKTAQNDFHFTENNNMIIYVQKKDPGKTIHMMTETVFISRIMDF